MTISMAQEKIDINIDIRAPELIGEIRLTEQFKSFQILVVN